MRIHNAKVKEYAKLAFIKKCKFWIYNIFAFLCIFDGFLNFWGCFYCGKLTKPWRHARTFQLVNQQSLASINNKNPKILTKKTAACSHHCSLRHPAPSLGHWYTGYTFGSSIQALAIPPPSWGSAPRWL